MPRWSGRRRRSRRSSGCSALAYLYTELTTDERAMGMFVAVLLAVLDIIPAFNPTVVPRPRGAAQPALHDPRRVAAVRLRELRAGLRARRHLRAAVQGDQGQAPRVLLRPAAVAAGARRDERAGAGDRLAVPDDRAGRRRDLGHAGAAARRIRVPRRCRWPIRRSWSRWSRGACIRSRCMPGGRSAGRGRRAAWLSAIAFAIVLLNFVPVGYFLTKSHNFNF